MVKRLPVKEFMEIYSKVPRLCLDFLIQTDEGILLTQRTIPPGVGFWHLPGVTVLFDEFLMDAIKRGVKEELGLKVKNVEFLKVIDWYKGNFDLGHTISLVYKVGVEPGTIKLNSEATKFGFFKIPPEYTMDEHKALF